MKKCIKCLKIVPLMMLLMFTLSGCVSLQDLRDDHAVWKDSKKKTIIWQEKEYVFLTDISESYFSPDFNLDDYINITEKDVPVLLSRYDGSFGYVSTDGKFINLYEQIYCIENEYEEMKQLLQNPPEINRFAYQYYANDEYSTACFEILEEEETKILEQILQECTDSYYETDFYEETMFIAEICKCSENKLFSMYLDTDINRNEDGKYIFCKYAEDYYGTAVIPDKYQDTIEEIFADAIKTAEETYVEY